MTSARTFLSRFPRWLYISLLALVLLIAGAAFFLEYRLAPILAKKIRETVRESSKGLYTLEFRGFDVNVFNGQINFDSLSFKPDSAVLAKLRSAEEAPRHVYQIDARALGFTGIDFRELYFDDKLDLTSIVFVKPKLRLTYQDQSRAEDKKDDRSIYERISNTLKSIRIGTIVLAEADIVYIDRTGEQASETKLTGINIEAVDLLIDSTSQSDSSRVFFSSDIRMNLKDHSFKTENGLYELSVKDFTTSTKEKIARLTGFRMKPLLPEIPFSYKFKQQQDRYDLTFKEILLRNLDFQLLNEQRRLQASSLIIEGADVDIFMNRALPPVSFDKGRNYPHVVIRRLKIPTVIDSLEIRNTRINYAEYNPKSKKTGRLSFTRFNALLRNVTNDKDRLAKDSWLRANVRTYLMNTAHMDVDLNLHLSAPNADFNFKGTIGAFDMRSLNMLSRNMSLAEIQSGRIQKGSFDVKGDWRTSSGTLRLYYKDLKVNVLKNDEESGELEKRGLISALANTLIIKNQNPDESGEFRIGKTNAYRIDSGSFFNLMWKSIFEGLKESVGFGSAESQPAPAADEKTNRKAEREKRREQRKQERREAREERRTQKQ